MARFLCHISIPKSQFGTSALHPQRSARHGAALHRGADGGSGRAFGRAGAGRQTKNLGDLGGAGPGGHAGHGVQKKRMIIWDIVDEVRLSLMELGNECK